MHPMKRPCGDDIDLYSSLPGGTEDDRRLVHALGQCGVSATIRPWGEGNGGILCSTWDYTERYEEFLAWTASMGGRLLNEPSLVRWNAHKSYLLDLEERGVRIVPTRMVRAGEESEVEGLIKPAIGASSQGVRRIERTRIRPDHDTLVQPVVEGPERCLIFFRGEFSHAVHRDVAAHEPTANELALAKHALDGIDYLYARVDLIGPLLLELELIEPELYLTAAAARRFAEAIVG